MAKKTRTELSTSAINTNLPDNTQELITPTTERAQLTDERESVINYKDDLGGTSNAGKFLTVATDGESLTMVDEPSGVPDWVTFVTAVNNLMKLTSGGNSGQLQFFDTDGTTLGAQISWVDGNNKLVIYNAQGQEEINLTGGKILLKTGGVTALTIDSSEATFSSKLSVSKSSTNFIAEFQNTNGTNPYGVRVKDASTPANNYPLFSVSNSGGTVEYFRVNSGTGAATFSSSAHQENLIINDVGNNEGGIRITTSTGTYYHEIRGNGDGLYIGADDNSQGGSGADIRFYVKGSEKMRISSGGDVGIGINPTAGYKLDVSGGDVRFGSGLKFASGSTLNAYEEGDWTNVYNTDSGINNFVDTYSRYTVIGNQVTLYYTFTIGFSTANVRSYVVLNLPFSQRTNTSSIGGSVSCEQNSSPYRASVGTIMDASIGDATRCYIAFWPPVNGNHTVEGIIVYEKS